VKTPGLAIFIERSLLKITTICYVVICSACVHPLFITNLYFLLVITVLYLYFGLVFKTPFNHRSNANLHSRHETFWAVACFCFTLL